jgi:hypothetical protein
MKQIITLILIVLLTSCSTFKETAKTSELRTSEVKSLKTDSLNTTTVNSAIADNFSFSLRTNNKVVDSILKERLKGFNSTKTSGKNTYQAKFDYDKMVLDIAALVGETVSTNVSTNKESTSATTFEEKIDTYVSKKIKGIPWWVYALAAFWFLPQILERIMLLINPVKTILKKLLNSS